MTKKVILELPIKVVKHYLQESLDKGYSAKLKPFLEAKLIAEAEGKKVSNKQTKMKL